jgi:hypothetical protein
MKLLSHWNTKKEREREKWCAIQSTDAPADMHKDTKTFKPGKEEEEKEKQAAYHSTWTCETVRKPTTTTRPTQAYSAQCLIQPQPHNITIPM